MSQIYRILPLALLLLTFSCKKKSSTGDTDNLFKFKDYISYHTQGDQSVSAPVDIVLAQVLDSYELNQELPGDLIWFTPKVDGKLIIENGRKLSFLPSQYLKPTTEYRVTLALDKIFGDLEREFREYTFAFRTIAPNFKIKLGNLQSYDKQWQYLSGTLDASDILDASKVNSVLKVKQGDREVPVKWDNSSQNAQYYSFKIDSISRTS